MLSPRKVRSGWKFSSWLVRKPGWINIHFHTFRMFKNIFKLLQNIKEKKITIFLQLRQSGCLNSLKFWVWVNYVNVHSIIEAAELESSREKEHAVYRVLQEWVMLYLWETFYSEWVLKQPITPSNHQNHHGAQTLTNRHERQCNSCGMEVFCRNADHKYCGGGKRRRRGSRGCSCSAALFNIFMRWFGLRFGLGPAGHESVMWQHTEVMTQVFRKLIHLPGTSRTPCAAFASSTDKRKSWF